MLLDLYPDEVLIKYNYHKKKTPEHDMFTQKCVSRQSPGSSGMLMTSNYKAIMFCSFWTFPFSGLPLFRILLHKAWFIVGCH